MLWLAVTLKLLAEIALMALIARGVLGLLAGAARERNPVYRLLDLLSRPALRLFRAISPRRVLDRHLPLLATLGLAWIWLAALMLKVSACRALPGQALCT